MKDIKKWNTDWKFKKNNWCDIKPGEIIEGNNVSLPHTWYDDNDYYQGEGVYQKVFDYIDNNKRAFIKFHGVDKVCEIYLNGKKVGYHEGGYNMFSVEISEYLKEGKNILTVFVSNAKQLQVSPVSGDFAVFGGIHRDVEFIETEEICFDRTYYGTDGLVLQTRVNEAGQGEVYAENVISSKAKEDIHIVYTVYDKDETIQEVTVDSDNDLRKVCVIEEPKLWNGIDSTYLYTVKASLMVNDKVVDEVEKKVGFRRIAIDAEKGFFLNGKHLKLHGVAKHQDSADVYSATTLKHWQKDMSLIHEVGANAVRLSHYPHPEGVYDLCDRIGFVVWAEIPLLKLTEDEHLFANAKYQLTEMILQNMHHPSICFWGLQNEIAIYGEFPYMVDKMKEINRIAKDLDSTRFTSCANLNVVRPDSKLNQITDVTSYNIYYGWYYGKFEDHGKFLDDFHKVNPNMPLGISEYGADTNPQYHSEDPKVNDYSEEFQAHYHEVVYPMMACRDFVWGSFVWNMFDFTSPIRNAANVKNRNIKGLVTFDRKTKKDSFYYYKAIWSKDPFVHIASKRFVNRASNTITIKVYTNQPEVVLLTKDKSIEAITENGSALFENIPLTYGINKFVAKAAGYTDEVIFKKISKPDEAYIYVDQNPGLNVRNWFLDEQSEEELFPKGFMSIRSSINDILASDQAIGIIDKRMPKIGIDIRDTVGTFSLEKYFQYTKPDCTDEEIKALNAELTKIAI